MPRKSTPAKSRRAKREGRAPTTQAGPFVQEEIEHVREGKHGARNPKQMIAIGLSKARRAGVDVPPPKKGTAAGTKVTRARAKRDLAKGKRRSARPNPTRSKATSRALGREGKGAGKGAASTRALSQQAHRARRAPSRGRKGKRARRGSRASA
jgi:hypothetical protein